MVNQPLIRPAISGEGTLGCRLTSHDIIQCILDLGLWEIVKKNHLVASLVLLLGDNELVRIIFPTIYKLG